MSPKRTPNKLAAARRALKQPSQISSRVAAPRSDDENLPDWLTETPEETTYSMDAYERNDASCQGIELTRDEYIALKAELAYLRGHIMPEAARPTKEGAAAEANSKLIHGTGDLMSVAEGIAALGACYSAFSVFIENAEPAEIRWLAEVLQDYGNGSGGQIDEIAEDHLLSVQHIFEKWRLQGAELTELRRFKSTHQAA